jgi:hypothetical protein
MKETKISASINLAKVNEDNLFINNLGEPILNIRILIDESEQIKIAQRYLKGNQKTDEGNYIETPILGSGVFIKKEEKVGIINRMFGHGVR